MRKFNYLKKNTKLDQVFRFAVEQEIAEYSNYV